MNTDFFTAQPKFFTYFPGSLHTVKQLCIDKIRDHLDFTFRIEQFHRLPFKIFGYSRHPVRLVDGQPDRSMHAAVCTYHCNVGTMQGGCQPETFYFGT